MDGRMARILVLAAFWGMPGCGPTGDAADPGSPRDVFQSDVPGDSGGPDAGGPDVPERDAVDRDDGGDPGDDAPPDAPADDADVATDGTAKPEDAAFDVEDALPDPDAADGDARDADAAPDVPDLDLPPRTSLAEGFHVPLRLPEPGEAFSLVVASDPQLWWNFEDGVEGLSDAQVEDRNRLHIKAMNALIDGDHLPADTPAPIAVVMNGDLTEYGRWVQWDAYYRLYGEVRAPILDGLGNHDYENNNFHVNQDGCAMDADDAALWQQACDAGSDRTLWDQDACTVVENFLELWGWCATDTMRRTRFWLRGHAEHLFDHDPYSGAYSWEIGDFHFIQIHNGPGFESPEAQICDPLPWLRKDLRAAFDRGKRIVLNMHKPIPSSLRDVLRPYRYHVVGIFYGHHHRYGGYTGDFVVDDVAIPRFYGGSVEWNLFTLARFLPDRLTVTTIDSNTGLPVHHDTAEAYENVGGAYVGAPFTYVFPPLPCPPGEAPDGPDGACVVPERDDAPLVPCHGFLGWKGNPLAVRDYFVSVNSSSSSVPSPEYARRVSVVPSTSTTA